MWGTNLLFMKTLSVSITYLKSGDSCTAAQWGKGLRHLTSLSAEPDNFPFREGGGIPSVGHLHASGWRAWSVDDCSSEKLPGAYVRNPFRIIWPATTPRGGVQSLRCRLCLWARSGYRHKPSQLQFCKESRRVAGASVKVLFSPVKPWQEGCVGRDLVNAVTPPHTLSVAVGWLTPRAPCLHPVSAPSEAGKVAGILQHCFGMLKLDRQNLCGFIKNKAKNVLELLELNIEYNYGTLVRFSTFTSRVVLCSPDIRTT